MLEQPVVFTGNTSIQFFNSPPFPNIVSHTWYPTTDCAALILYELNIYEYDMFNTIVLNQ